MVCRTQKQAEVDVCVFLFFCGLEPFFRSIICEKGCAGRATIFEEPKFKT
jgi:hypothetical protein